MVIDVISRCIPSPFFDLFPLQILPKSHHLLISESREPTFDKSLRRMWRLEHTPDTTYIKILHFCQLEEANKELVCGTPKMNFIQIHVIQVNSIPEQFFKNNPKVERREKKRSKKFLTHSKLSKATEISINQATSSSTHWS